MLTGSLASSRCFPVESATETPLGSQQFLSSGHSGGGVGAELNPQARRQLWDLVDGLKQAGRTIILTTHYMDEAERLCDRIAIMDHGRIITL
jgi:hypothetical protein